MKSAKRSLRLLSLLLALALTLPLLFSLSGCAVMLDNMMGDGDGVKTVFGEYKRAGVKKVILKLYADCRHEILNDVYKQRVINDMLDFLAEI